MTPSTMRAMAIPAFGKPMQPVTVPVPKTRRLAHAT